MKTLYNEDFKDFPLGEFPYDKGHTALGEYHTIIPKGYRGNWYDPIANHQWRSQGGSWLISSDGTKRYLNQNRGDNSTGHFSSVSALLILKDKIYSSYTYESELELFDTSNYSGFVFNYITSRNYYSLSFKDKMVTLYRRNQEDVEVIKSVSFNVESSKCYKIKLQISNDFKCYIDGNLYIEEKMEFIPSKAGVIGKGISRFSNIKIEMTDEEYNNHLNLKNAYDFNLKEKASKYPPLKLIKKIDLKYYGSGRQFRVAHKENGEVFFIFAQHEKRVMRDSFAHISCLSAIDLDGNLLWQIGEPSDDDDNSLISCDLPFQVSDINNDGRDELIYSRDFKVHIVDAITLKEIKSMYTPFKDELFDKNYPFDRLNVDAIRVADFKGEGYQGGFIIKDRYKNVFAYDSDLNLLFRYNYKNTGHFPYIWDFNSDGRDEMYVGYSYVDSDGNIKWSLPIESDHTDEIIYINTKESEPKRLYLASGNEGFNIVNMDGTIHKHNEVGHAQRISIANYDKKSKNLQICVTSFWGANDIVYMFDCDGEKVAEREFMTNGNVITPVSYDGENMLVYASPCVGLLDYDLDVVVELPNDGHPTLCAEAIDIDSDGISEILAFDRHSMYIYKASSFKEIKIEEYPKNAMSNYRGEFIKKIN